MKNLTQVRDKNDKVGTNNSDGIKSSHKAKQNKPKTKEFTEDMSAGALQEMSWAGW